MDYSFSVANFVYLTGSASYAGFSKIGKFVSCSFRVPNLIFDVAELSHSAEMIKLVDFSRDLLLIA